MASLKRHDWLGLQARYRSRAPFLRQGATTYSFQAADRLVSHLCQELATVQTDRTRPRVGIASRDPLLTALLVLGCTRLGWPVTVLNPNLPHTLQQQQINQAGLSRLLVSAQCHSTTEWPDRMRVPVHGVTLPSLQDTRTAQIQPHVPATDLHRLQGYVFTSGSTGQPKAVPVHFGHVYWSAVTSAYRLGYSHTDCWLHCLPLYHIGGLALLFRAVLFGFCLDLQTGFDTAAVLESLQANRFTLASLVPTMLVRLLDAGLHFRDRPTAFRWALMGGAKLSRELRRECSRRRIPLVGSYGLTESCSHITATWPGQTQGAGEGQPLLHARVAIRDQDGHNSPPLTAGSIWLQGPQICIGPGWQQTGDVGYLDEQGSLHVLARQDEVYISGGENVYGPEVVAVIEQHPAIRGAWVTGIADREWGHRIVALAELHPDTQLTTSLLRDHCRRLLPAYKVPRNFLFVDALPRTGSGKVQQAAARKLVPATWP